MHCLNLQRVAKKEKNINKAKNKTKNKNKNFWFAFFASLFVANLSQHDYNKYHLICTYILVDNFMLSPIVVVVAVVWGYFLRGVKHIIYDYFCTMFHQSNKISTVFFSALFSHFVLLPSRRVCPPSEFVEMLEIVDINVVTFVVVSVVVVVVVIVFML